ncbi:rho GTPase-activating protein 24-like [Saccoglossus kowalevskii]|uniref:Rho GTPase-activating protein 24-like n=1 Tax=Saccoglossus kowalevskii TaxID=10224 RepID=A0ABM0GK52_SACKO|nr:PREDICTED: rho GTPase-activating protein 24-like [Saccoglossus kowalevskii]
MISLGPGLQPEVIHTGWLKKQGGMVKNWQKRWFVLVGQELKYFTNEDEKKQMGTIQLAGNKVHVFPFNPDDPSKYLFEIKPGDGQHKMSSSHDTYLLCSQSAQERDEWVRKIRRVMYGHLGGGVFGQSLTDILTTESVTSTKVIPNIIEQCVTFLREKGLEEEGIFRLAGRSALVKELQEAYDTGQKPDFYEQNADVHSVASLLKSYLRHLPEPVIPWVNYDLILVALRQLSTDYKNGREELIRQLAFLPRCNYNVLKYLCEFLHDVQIHKDKNKMDLKNLATVFGPNIFRPKVDKTDSIMENASLSQKLMHMLIEDSEGMFPKNDQINFSPFGKEPEKVKVLTAMAQPDLLSGDDARNGRMPDSILMPIPAESAAANEKLSNRNSVLGDLLGELSEDSVRVAAEINKTGTIPIHSTLLNLDETACSVKEENDLDEPVPSPRKMGPPIPTRPAPTAPARSSTQRQIPKIPQRPKVDEVPNAAPDMTLSFSTLKMQVEALKTELLKQREEYESKILFLNQRYDVLEIKLKNETKSKIQAEERNQELVKNIEAFCKKHDVQI